MIKKYVRKTGLKSEKQDRILEVLYENPNKDFTIRKIEKLTKLPKTTISDYLKEMKKRGLLKKDSLLFKIKKINHFVEKIVFSELIKNLTINLNPSCIILFGSIRKGDSDKSSDIDLFIETPLNKKLNLKKYEKILKHPIQIFIEKDINNLQDNLFNNVINGIKLFGSLKLK